MKKKIFIALGVFYLIFMVLMFAAMNGEDKNPNLLTIEKFGENYPYTINNVELKCSLSAVWVETQNGEKYALNNLGANYLKNDASYKGTTNLIMKPNKTDFDFLNKGFEMCKK